MRPPSRNLALAALVAFGLGAGARIWHGAAPSQKSKRHLAANSFDPTTKEKAPTAGAAKSTEPPADAAPPPPPESRDSVDGILEARGLEQAERLGRFLVSATPADLERLLLCLQRQFEAIPETLGDAIFLRWMSVDPSGGRAMADRLNLLFTAGWAWGKTNPKAALAAALADSDNRLGIAVLRAIGQSDPQRARLLLEEHPRFREAGSMAGLADGLMRTDPAAGATLAAAWSFSIDDNNLLTDWGRRDPHAAFEWALGLPDFSRRTEALRLLMDRWARRDPEGAAAALEALPDGRAKWEMLAGQAGRLAADDPQAARAWIEALPHESLRREASMEVARQLASTDPSASLTLLKSLDWKAAALTAGEPAVLEPEGSVPQTLAAPALPASALVALEEIGASRPSEALGFLATLPEDIQKSAAESICGPWMQRDPMAYSTWLAVQPEGALRSQATTVLVHRLLSTRSPDFEAAFQWALTLPEQGANSMTKRVITQWSQADPEAAHAALQDPGVPEELRSISGAAAAPGTHQP